MPVFKNTPSHRLAESLQKAGYTVEQLPVDETRTLEQLRVQIDPDRDYHLDLAFASAARAAMQADANRPSQEDEDVDYLQFYAPLPLPIEPAYLPNVARLVLHLNSIMPLVGFGVDASGQILHFRHMMMVERGQVNTRLVIETVEIVEFLLSEFGVDLEDVALGHQSAEQVIANL